MKLLSELTVDELRKVFNANDELYRLVIEDLAETEMIYIGEQLHHMRGLSSWSIGQGNRDQHIHVNKPLEFIESVRELQKDYAILNIEDEKALIKAETVANQLISASMYDDRYYELEDELEAIADRIADYLVDEYTRILDDYCLNNDNLLDYFINFYSEERLDGGCYTDENYILYNDVSYTKSYT